MILRHLHCRHLYHRLDTVPGLLCRHVGSEAACESKRSIQCFGPWCCLPGDRKEPLRLRPEALRTFRPTDRTFIGGEINLVCGKSRAVAKSPDFFRDRLPFGPDRFFDEYAKFGGASCGDNSKKHVRYIRGEQIPVAEIKGIPNRGIADTHLLPQFIAPLEIEKRLPSQVREDHRIRSDFGGECL